MTAPIQTLAILQVVAEQAGITVADLKAHTGTGRTPINCARQRAVMLLKRLRPDLSWRKIARVLARQYGPDMVRANRSAEARLADSVAEQLAVAAMLEGLGVPELPPRDPAKAYAKYLLDCAVVHEARAADLRARAAQLIEPTAGEANNV